jgi:hypothetical protein
MKNFSSIKAFSWQIGEKSFPFVFDSLGMTLGSASSLKFFIVTSLPELAEVCRNGIEQHF